MPLARSTFVWVMISDNFDAPECCKNFTQRKASWRYAVTMGRLLLPPALWDAPFAPGQLDASGASPGAGGIVAIDDSMSIRDIVRHLSAYNAAESCGKCTPCREGTVRMVELLDELPTDAATRLVELSEAMIAASLCGLGQMAPLPYMSARRHFGDDLLGGAR